MAGMVIGIDFDGTLALHRYPDIGEEIPGAFKWLKEFQKAGARLMLWTMRSGKELDEAVEWCRVRGIEFWGVNKNHNQHWTTSPKQYAHKYIDDAALGCPLRKDESVDWEVVGPMMMGCITDYG